MRIDHPLRQTIRFGPANSDFGERTLSDGGNKILAASATKYGPIPAAFTFGDGIEWSSQLEPTRLYVELPFWLMMPAGDVDVEWSGTTFKLTIMSPWMEVFVHEVTDSRASCMHQGPLDTNWAPSAAIAAELKEMGGSLMARPCKTVVRLNVRAHADAFRKVDEDTEPPRVRAEQRAYWASLCEAHIPVLNELIQRYRLVTYDYFAFEVSPWDVPVWYVGFANSGYTAILLTYKEWDSRPVTVEEGDGPDDSPKLKPFQWTTAAELDAAASSNATPGEFDLLDARNLMERGDYTGAVRRTVTAIEAVVAWALLAELEAKYASGEALVRLARTDGDFPGRVRQWRKLADPPISDSEFALFEETRTVRHQIVHRGLRLVHDDRGRAQKYVDTGRWLYNKIEAKPDRMKLRETHGVLKSIGRTAMAVRFPAAVDSDGITLGPLGFGPPPSDPAVEKPQD
jgi:hypothetical protein